MNTLVETAQTAPAAVAGSGPDGKISVVVLFGGRSSEHAISVVTAAGVISAIDKDKYQVIPIGITKHGQWVIPDPNFINATLDSANLPEIVTASEGEVMLSLLDKNKSVRQVWSDKPPVELGKVDVVFPLLHGPFGEDGTLQGLLELSDVPYVGCGLIASATGMDKHYMKVLFQSAGLAVGPYEVVLPREWENDPAAVTERISHLQMPLFVKPARAGSSIGITRITSLDQLPAAIAEAQKSDPKIVVEQGIVGREIECAVLSGRQGAAPRTSLPGEVVVKGADFYDFQAKYLGVGEAVTEIPADLPPEVIAEVRAVAVRAFEALEGEGLARVDVFVTPEHKVIVNEINTMPGFTPISMYPQMWEASGLPYPQLLDELIQLALERPVGLR
ncbi:MAG: D-alanine--D-alanine ligase [Cellulomonadaceae bacterium]|jgi:D-alanine-D-alanine ligase|nr:D-alanine--D-alanine ligase [Cellulomonadaceae bacterium]